MTSREPPCWPIGSYRAPVSISLAIVIVNWNSGQQLRECLASVPLAAMALPVGHRIEKLVIVDNQSTDGSDVGLDAGGLPLQLIRNASNRGFAAACNQGAAAAPSADLLLFLNPDTRLFADSLRIPLAAMDEQDNRKVGIAGIQLVDDSGRVSRSCSRFPAPHQVVAQAFGLDRLIPSVGQAMRDWAHDSSRQVDQVIGAFFLVRGALFRQLGGFDERFFVYFEEVDFAYRARQLGWTSLYLSTASAYHKGGGTSEQVRAHRLFYALRSRLQYFNKHGSLMGRALVWMTTILVEPVARAAQLLLRRRASELADLVGAYRLLLAWLGSGRRAQS